MVYIKIHLYGGSKVVAMCDENLIGKVFTEDELKLDLDKHKAFYMGESIEDIEQIRAMVSGAESINAVGEEAVKILSELGFDTENMIRIEKIPHIIVVHI